MDNHRQEPWKMPLPDYIEHLYAKAFGRSRSDVVMSIEGAGRARLQEKKKAAKREAKRQRRLSTLSSL